MGRILAYWSECPCVVQQIDESERLTRQMEAQKREAERIQETAYDLQTLAKQGTMTLDTFRPEYLRTTTPEAHPLHIATDWLKAILRQQVVGSFRSGEVAALFFLGQPGRGKTHLAIALLLEAMRREHRAAFLNEAQYFDQRLTLPFDRLEELVSVPSERAWLTCFDDIGKLAPSDKKKQQSAQANWYRMLDKRYNLRRWTIFTSEKTIEELHKQGTFDDALAGRVHEMTRGKYIVFDGVNVRFREADL